MTVKILKMINGEVIIGDIIAETDSTYTVKSPASVILRENQTTGTVGVGLADFMPYAKGDVTLRLTAITAESEADEALVNEYNRIFGSGIVIATADALPK